MRLSKVDLKTLGNVLRKPSFIERKMDWDILFAISCFSDDPQEKIINSFCGDSRSNDLHTSNEEMF